MTLNRKIEDRAISALQSLINLHSTMDCKFQTKDKDLSWDGYIRIFKNDDEINDKENYDDDIPVQIKGHNTSKRISQPDIKKISVDLCDLRVYLRREGCLYFHIFVQNDCSDTTIYYASLFPSKINVYLKEAENNGNKKSISIPFIKMDKSHIKLYEICKQYSLEIRIQGSGLGQIVSNSINASTISNVKSLSASFVGTSHNDMLNHINNGDLVLHGITDESGIQYPIQMKLMCASFTQTSIVLIGVGDKIYYNSIEIESITATPDNSHYKKGINHNIRLSPNLSMSINHGSIDFTFRYYSDLHTLKHDAEFLLDLFDARRIIINNNEFPLVGFSPIDAIKETLEAFVEVGNVLDDCECKLLIPYKDLSDDDLKQINLLLRIKNNTDVFKNEHSSFIYIWSIRDKKWPIVIDKSKNKIYGFLYNCNYITVISNNTDIKDKQLNNSVPHFYSLSPSMLVDLLWYDYDSMIKQVDRADYNELTESSMNILSLNLMSAYDINNDEKLLYIASEILRRLRVAFPHNAIYFINSCQIEFRQKGKLTIKQKRGIDDIIDNIDEISNGSESVKNKLFYCCYILKGDIGKAKDIFSKFSEDEKCIINKWPITVLIK